MPTDPFEIDELLGAYALDAVDEDERRAVEEYLLASPRARMEVQDHREVATMLAWSGMDAPDGLWERIAGSLDAPAVAPTGELGRVLALRPPRPSPRLRTTGAWLGACAAAALIVVVAIKFSRPAGDTFSANGIERAVAQAVANPASVEAQLVSSTDASLKVRAVVDPQGHGYLLADSLPALDASHTYQLWGQINGQLISLGVLGPRPETAIFTVSGTVTQLAITDEAEGGVMSSEQPVVVGGALG
jgi:anti-sigma factor RsiW